eukprot:GHVT01089796.1.p1 GENE.GHVT01089796.1~~GHVT01089796.1.p1  ORF type:complete len:105 (-),score=6.74 GHVT01089796.1:17-331(-)
MPTTSLRALSLLTYSMFGHDTYPQGNLASEKMNYFVHIKNALSASLKYFASCCCMPFAVSAGYCQPRYLLLHQLPAWSIVFASLNFFSVLTQIINFFTVGGSIL